MGLRPAYRSPIRSRGVWWLDCPASLSLLIETATAGHRTQVQAPPQPVAGAKPHCNWRFAGQPGCRSSLSFRPISFASPPFGGFAFFQYDEENIAALTGVCMTLIIE